MAAAIGPWGFDPWPRAPVAVLLVRRSDPGSRHKAPFRRQFFQMGRYLDLATQSWIGNWSSGHQFEGNLPGPDVQCAIGSVSVVWGSLPNLYRDLAQLKTKHRRQGELFGRWGPRVIPLTRRYVICQRLYPRGRALV